MPDSLVADAGGLLVLAGLLEGEPPEAGEILAVDATALLVAEYLAVRHEGAPDRARRDFGLCVRVVAEWFPVRSVAIEAAIAAGREAVAESVASLICAEQLGVDLATTNRDLSSTRVRVWRC